MAGWFEEKKGKLMVRVKVKPRASRNKVGEPVGDYVPVWVTAPPVDSRANDELIAMLAKKLGLPKSSITISAGEKSRTKTIEVQGISGDDLEKLLGK